MEVSSVQHHQGDEEEFVLLDINSVSGQLDIPSNAPYVLSGLDTLNPVLIIDEKLKLIGEYEETIGTCLVFTEEAVFITLFEPPHDRRSRLTYLIQEQSPIKSFLQPHCLLFWLRVCAKSASLCRCYPSGSRRDRTIRSKPFLGKMYDRSKSSAKQGCKTSGTAS
ncbi:uncharacterized protein LOC122318886 isoform X1 [Carya illinoinensis]|uniref:uncharacterized protein LOC122318886 isoform X1 n=1 Tax=Carya illinoinensis TaxID=32201 RepID=UPI001C71E25F|nr:uncharacterized protein LOC122318886 isoform X1 [Carya illinoinensis]XP_042992548.1 uncharacterized protein LOC122318886 isoform X1 [Carya illinoinensis]XP_042992550.1 uncharacterized protein LOC122318886 isoform X1 [Carya illinoinensis]